MKNYNRRWTTSYCKGGGAAGKKRWTYYILDDDKCPTASWWSTCFRISWFPCHAWWSEGRWNSSSFGCKFVPTAIYLWKQDYHRKFPFDCITCISVVLLHCKIRPVRMGVYKSVKKSSFVRYVEWIIFSFFIQILLHRWHLYCLCCLCSYCLQDLRHI